MYFGLGVVPGDERLEALVALELGPDRMLGDAPAELAQPRERPGAGRLE